jgi:hypothetical protein
VITSKQAEEACCYDVSLPFPFLFCSVLFVGGGMARGWNWDMNEDGKKTGEEQNSKTRACKTPVSRGFLKFGLARFLATLY